MYLSYPHPSIANEVNGMKGTFADLTQLVEIGMLREKKMDIRALFDWDENEVSELLQLSWRSSKPNTLENRK